MMVLWGLILSISILIQRALDLQIITEVVLSVTVGSSANAVTGDELKVCYAKNGLTMQSVCVGYALGSSEFI